MSRKPTAFDLSSIDPEPNPPQSKAKRKPTAKQTATARIEVTPDPFDLSAVEADELDALEPAPARFRMRGFTMRKLFLAASGLLISLGLGLAVENLVQRLFEAWPPLGWAALGASALVLVIALIFAIREILALRRLAKLDAIRSAVTEARHSDDGDQAVAISRKIMALYAARPQAAAGRGHIESHAGDLMSAETRLDLTERALMKPLDDEARGLVTKSASRVAVVTAVSPRALVDVGYVLFENMRLIRAIAELYGLRPGSLGSIRLAASVVGHLAVTGTIAVGDSLIQQAIGTGVAAKLSARFGEGVVNGLLTARIGIAATDLCRPMPFNALPRPTIGEFVNPVTALSRGKGSE
jgi:putative membrane protein